MLKLHRGTTLEDFEGWLRESEFSDAPNDTCTLHPSEDLVRACFTGQLDYASEMIAVIKGHVERCAVCQQVVRNYLHPDCMRHQPFFAEKIRVAFEIFMEAAKKQKGFVDPSAEEQPAEASASSKF